MGNMPRMWNLVLLSAVVPLLHPACSVPDFEYRTENASNSSTAVSSSSSGDQGPTSSSSSGSGGQGGAPPTCTIDDLGKVGVCGSGQKCTVVQSQPFEVGCALAGNKEAWFSCIADNDCADGTWCDAFTETCKPFCVNSAECQFSIQGECIPATTKQGSEIKQFSNVRVCLPNCNPKTADICGGDNTTCLFFPGYGFDCVRSGMKKVGIECNAFNDCEPGTLCAGPMGQQTFCVKWCSPVGNSSDCSSNQDCGALTPTAIYNSVEHGVCTDAG